MIKSERNERVRVTFVRTEEELARLSIAELIKQIQDRDEFIEICLEKDIKTGKASEEYLKTFKKAGEK